MMKPRLMAPISGSLNSLLADSEYVDLLRFKIPEFVIKCKEVEDKALFWEMVKKEIRSLTIKFPKLRQGVNAMKKNSGRQG